MNIEEQRQAIHSLIESGEISLEGVISYTQQIMGKRSGAKMSKQERVKRAKNAAKARWGL